MLSCTGHNARTHCRREQGQEEYILVSLELVGSLVLATCGWLDTGACVQATNHRRVAAAAGPVPLELAYRSRPKHRPLDLLKLL